MNHPVPTASTALRRRGLLVGCMLAAPVVSMPALADEAHPQKAPQPGAVEVRLVAKATVLKVRLRDDKLKLVTPYGELLIPVADIHRIDFATRLSGEEAKRLASALADLGNRAFRVRTAATAELLAMGEKAYPALLRAARHEDAEIRRRAAGVLEKLREEFTEEELLGRKHDVVQTEHSRIAGRLSATVLRADSSKGQVQLRVGDLRSLWSPSAGEVDLDRAAPDPGNLTGFQNQPGKTFVFKVTGNATAGALWGTDRYTTDSSLAMAAVHAGVLKVGQTGVVRVTMVAPPASFAGSTRHGVTSSPWGAYPAAFRVKK